MHPHIAISTALYTKPRAAGRPPQRVSEQDYWAHWYEHPDFNFAWYDGQLEEVPVSDPLTGRVYYWVLELLLHDLRRHPVAKPFGLETGFRLALPDGKVSIRKPALGFIHVDNPIQGADTDTCYTGTATWSSRPCPTAAQPTAAVTR